MRKGEVGFVRDIGTFLQQFYIYAVDWIDSGTLVGMRGKELMRPRRDARGRRRQGDGTMKVMIRRGEKGLCAYVPKKDLEEPIVETEREDPVGRLGEAAERLDADPARDAAGDEAADHRQRQEAWRGRMTASAAERALIADFEAVLVRSFATPAMP